MLSRSSVEPPMQTPDEAPRELNNCVHLSSVKARQMDAKI